MTHYSSVPCFSCEPFACDQLEFNLVLRADGASAERLGRSSQQLLTWQPDDRTLSLSVRRSLLSTGKLTPSVRQQLNVSLFVCIRENVQEEAHQAYASFTRRCDLAELQPILSLVVVDCRIAPLTARQVTFRKLAPMTTDVLTIQHAKVRYFCRCTSLNL